MSININGFNDEQAKRLSIKMYYESRLPKDNSERSKYLYNLHMLYKAKGWV